MSGAAAMRGPDSAARDAAVHYLRGGNLLAVATLGRDPYAPELARRCGEE